MNNREQFEDWYVREYPWGHDVLSHAEFIGDDDCGRYNDLFFAATLTASWKAWNAASKASEQQLSESRREFRAADATIHNLDLKVEQVVAENARCKFEVSRCHQTVDEMFKHREKWIDKEWLSSIWSTSKRLMNETPITDAAIANIQAQGVEMFADKTEREANGYGMDSHDWRRMMKVRADAIKFAAQLRKGAAQ